jgi:hypothetical protein
MMNTSRIQRGLLPLSVFVGVLLLHFLWTGLFPEVDPAQSRWLEVGTGTSDSWLRRYIDTQSYWLGYSYGLSLAFAAAAFRRWREQRQCATRNVAIGGLTLSEFLAVAGCFLVGCCGSPMLVVYLNLFGASFLPFAKPIVAGITTLTIVGLALWMSRRIGTVPSSATFEASGQACDCE